MCCIQAVDVLSCTIEETRIDRRNIVGGFHGAKSRKLCNIFSEQDWMSLMR